MIENSIQLKTKNSTELLYPITKSGLVQFPDGATLDEKLGNVSINGAIVISKPVVACGDINLLIGVTIYGELTTEEVESQTTGDVILKSESGHYYKVIALETGELETEAVEIVETEEEVIQQVYIQTPEPHGLIFKIGVLDDGTLLTSPICDIDLIDDDNISATTTWSSNKLRNLLSDIKPNIPIATDDKDGLLSKEDKIKIDTYESKINANTTKINAHTSNIDANTSKINANTNRISTAEDNIEEIGEAVVYIYEGLTNELNTMNTKINSKLDKSAITISTAQPSGGKHGDIWIVYE